MLAHDGNLQSNISSATDEVVFNLLGGLYGLTAKATWGGGSAILKRLCPDGSTYVAAATTITADGYATAYLAPGSYYWTVATATAVYLGLDRIPLG